MTALTEFLRQQKHAATPRRQAQRRKQWLSALEGLHAQIRGWLARAQKQKLIKIRSEKVRLTEEELGTYMAPCLHLVVGAKTVKLVPKGATVIGADGRVDLESTTGSFVLLYLAEHKKWVQGIGMRPSDFPTLNEELFTELFKRALA